MSVSVIFVSVHNMNICSLNAHLRIFRHTMGFGSQSDCLSVLEEHCFFAALFVNIPFGGSRQAAAALFGSRRMCITRVYHY